MVARTAYAIWTLGMTAAGLSVVAAGSGMWLILSRPDTVARAVTEGRVTPLVQALASALIEAWQALASWL